MPLKTVMSYQHHSGTSMVQAFKNLYTDGGFTRYYRGFSAALFQGPLFRFVDAAAYSFIIKPLESNEHLRMLPQPVRTAIASFAAVGCRTVLTPISTIKTILQAQGNTGIAMLKDRIIDYGIGTLWHGGAVTAAATFVGHYPWFATYNYLDANLPPAHITLAKLSRDAFVGLAASVVSDIASNSLRVIKTYRQASNSRIGYTDTIKAIIATNGLKELFGRGLKTRLLTSGFQGPMYSVLWKFFTEMFVHLPVVHPTWAVLL
ncbi:hypothetical protein AMATHDRAFT_194624 [Amanita thiersii Skay4041]|uniref:Mitochondrial carrier n=1 Tax=Amanita thiersii Skay4041 TaxID=703135 RepID=A0A2A9NPH9_9AGAR|nr:hypothetical protein AMATHDRAFT_194624 [Amanita thiersii Skay4041]